MDYNELCQHDITLRDYQQKAKEDIFSQWNYVDNILYQMPTGTGKTRLFTSIIRDINVWGLRHNIFFRILIKNAQIYEINFTIPIIKATNHSPAAKSSQKCCPGPDVTVCVGTA